MCTLENSPSAKRICRKSVTLAHLDSISLITSVSKMPPAPVNRTDYVHQVDLTVTASTRPATPNSEGSGEGTSRQEEREPRASPSGTTDATKVPTRESSQPTDHNQSLLDQTASFFKRSTKVFDNLGGGIHGQAAKQPVPLDRLVQAFAESDIAKGLQNDIDAAVHANQTNGDLRDVAEDTYLGVRRKASWMTQFRILSGRAFKNLYRDPALLTAHYSSSIILACEFGDYRGVTN